MSRQAIFYAQSGGATSVINATAAGVILAARAVGRPLYVGRNGICGALAEELIDTRAESEADIEALSYVPGCAFGSCRLKLPSFDDNPAVYARIFDVFDAHDVGICLYNGGGDSQDTVSKLASAGKCLGYPLRVIGLPKTIDNDLAGTDCSPGYGSAARYIATATREVYCDLSAMAPTSSKVFLLEVMGRNTGWLALAGGLAHGANRKLPIMLLMPEQVWSWERCVCRVQKLIEESGCAVLVVAEGISDKLMVTGEYDWHFREVTQRGGLCSSDCTRVDVFGHRQMSGAAPILAEQFRHRLGCKIQWAVAGYLQRAAAHLASLVDREQARAVGTRAVELAAAGVSGVMVTIERLSSQPYRWRLGSIAVSEVANRVVGVPAEFWDEQRYDISGAGREYLEPLIAGESTMRVDAYGLPNVITLNNRLLAQRLPKISWRDWF